MNFEEINLIIEGVSKSQKEAGQREMVAQNNQLKNQLISWFNNRWGAKNAYKAGLTLDKKKIEKERLDRILKKIDDVQNRGNALEFRKRVKETTGIPVQWETGELDQYSKDSNVKACLSWTDPKKKKFWSDEQKRLYKTSPEDLIEVKLNTYNNSIDAKLDSLHEYKHLLDFLKEIIINGKYKGGVDTRDEIHARHIKKIQRIEGQANAHALDNMYRKDRLGYLAGNEDGRIIANTKLQKIPKKVNSIFKDVYAQGTVRYSKTLKNSKKNIQPAVVDTLHRILKSCFNTPEGKTFLKQSETTAQKFYNVKVISDNDMYSFLNYSASKNEFRVGKAFFNWLHYHLNYENTVNFAKNKQDLDYIIRILKEGMKN